MTAAAVLIEASHHGAKNAGVAQRCHIAALLQLKAVTVDTAGGIYHQRKLQVDLSLGTGRGLPVEQDGRQNHDREVDAVSLWHGCCLAAHRKTSLWYC
jgi:hypothetical protein